MRDLLDSLDPVRSAVVEACAGSGKTWLLVSRMVRLLLAGAKPSEILAITFTRKAAQEMQARLREWLHKLKQGDDACVRDFFAERGLASMSDEELARARGLHDQVLLAQPSLTISTFHGWFMQVLQRAPLDADVMQGMTLLERAGAVQEEAWEKLLEQMHNASQGELARHMQWLFEEYGLFNTRRLLFSFLGKRAEWWAYTDGHPDALAYALDRLRSDLGVDEQADPAADWGRCGLSKQVLFAFVKCLGHQGTDLQQKKAGELERAWTNTAPEKRFEMLWPLLFKPNGEPYRIGATKKQDRTTFDRALASLQDSLQRVRDMQTDQAVYRLNKAVLSCGAALLDRYQSLKAQQQQMDFTDLEWQLSRLLQRSEYAETMQYKLDSRYRHVLLDEFQDTNPLQWQIMRAWFDAAAAVQSQPTVFLVGDPKQSIYRFRRADARLFDVARDYLEQHFGAQIFGNNHTHRNAPPIVAAVNAVFGGCPEGFAFVEHQTRQQALPGYVQVLPLAEPPPEDTAENTAEVLVLRDPLATPRREHGEGARHREAEEFAAQLQEIVHNWVVHEEDRVRRAAWGDIMVLVRSRTHLAIYEEALRRRHIPFISSRRGGLLDTLEAEDMQALLLFLITPFADLQLAHVLRTPIFACRDEDLMRLAADGPGWWQHLLRLASPSPGLARARECLQRWLAWADRLPVHDLLDRIYFEGEVIARYSAMLPAERRAKVVANLHAFMEIALLVDAGRYPSLPRFLQELRELRDSEDEAPNEGSLGTVGSAVRIYTVHEAKGLDAPIVWLLDAAAWPDKSDSHDVLVDWPPECDRPRHFLLYAGAGARGGRCLELLEREREQRRREEINLLYVAMTRAKQALIVSGSASARARQGGTWYERISEVVQEQPNPLLRGKPSGDVQAAHSHADAVALPPAFPIGKRTPAYTLAQQRGVWLHALLEYLANGEEDSAWLLQRLGIPEEEAHGLLQQARAMLAAPALSRFFDATQYRAAYNEMSYVNGQGELRRIDRLVEFEDEVWVLDYKSGSPEEAARHRAQMEEYRTAMQAVYPGRQIRCGLVFPGPAFVEI